MNDEAKTEKEVYEAPELVEHEPLTEVTATTGSRIIPSSSKP